MRITLPARNITLIAFALLAFVVVMPLAFCGRSASDANKTASTENAGTSTESRAVEVTTTTATAQEVAAYIQATGSFAADESSDVAPEVSGQVISTPVDVGAFVKQGAVIAQLEDRDARLRLQQALAAEQQAQSAVRQAQERLGLNSGDRFDVNNIPEVRAALRQFEAADAQAKLAEANANRYASLVKTGDVSQMTYDQARAQADSARAQANAARQNYELAMNVARQSNVGIATAQAQLEAARSQVGLARKALSDTTITAPFSGHVSDRPVAAGEYVTPASKIATILKTNPIKLRLQVPELDAARIRVGMGAEVTVDAYPDEGFTGKVTAINPAVELTSRAVVVEVEIENRNNKVRPGMFATARIHQSGGGQGTFVSRNAVMEDPNTNSFRAFVIEGETARLRVVQVGEQDANSVRIVSGVSPGEIVATSNLEQLYDGATVVRR
ncbi:MAG TPA: efflux RND transporter periplasmic adaptor subunit [Blastocatellia bacterium]|nr:efflux RND transporter periplasmic adaptor subunit [Blastocatellia bacterium]